METGSEDYLLFAMVLVDSAGEFVSIAEDMESSVLGEMRALQDLDGFNALICVSRRRHQYRVLQHLKFNTMKRVANIPVSALPGARKKANEEACRKGDARSRSSNKRQPSWQPFSFFDDQGKIEAEAKMRHKGSGPAEGKPFERAERQAIERFQKQMQLKQEKALIAANRPTGSCEKTVDFTQGLKAYSINRSPTHHLEARNDELNEHKNRDRSRIRIKIFFV